MTCSHVISSGGLTGRVCELCAAIGPIHIQSEGSRLLAALVKYCNSAGILVFICLRFLYYYIHVSAELLEKIATKDCIKWICKLLESEHALMVNDGLLALTLLSTLGNGMVN